MRRLEIALWHCKAGDRRKCSLVCLDRDEGAAGYVRINRWGRFTAITHPLVQGQEKRAHCPIVVERINAIRVNAAVVLATHIVLGARNEVNARTGVNPKILPALR